MGVGEKILEVSLPSVEDESQTLIIFVPNDYQETALTRTSLYPTSQNTNPITVVENSLHGSYTSL